jgi:hypothetical protein
VAEENGEKEGEKSDIRKEARGRSRWTRLCTGWRLEPDSAGRGRGMQGLSSGANEGILVIAKLQEGRAADSRDFLPGEKPGKRQKEESIKSGQPITPPQLEIPAA